MRFVYVTNSLWNLKPLAVLQLSNSWKILRYVRFFTADIFRIRRIKAQNFNIFDKANQMKYSRSRIHNFFFKKGQCDCKSMFLLPKRKISLREDREILRVVSTHETLFVKLREFLLRDLLLTVIYRQVKLMYRTPMLKVHHRIHAFFELKITCVRLATLNLFFSRAANVVFDIKRAANKSFRL